MTNVCTIKRIDGFNNYPFLCSFSYGNRKVQVGQEMKMRIIDNLLNGLMLLDMILFFCFLAAVIENSPY